MISNYITRRMAIFVRYSFKISVNTCYVFESEITLQFEAMIYDDKSNSAR